MKTAIALTTVLLLSFAPAYGQTQGDVYLGDVEGLTNGSILVESSGVTNVTFNINYRNNGSDPAKGISNGFEISGSDSSVTWEDLAAWQHPDFVFDPFNVHWWYPPFFHGIGTDTIGFATSGLFLEWVLPTGWDGPALVFSVAMADTASVGGTFCIDSSWFPSDGVWMWAYGSTVGSFAPTWDGPHCWPIIGSCCLGQRGNVDGDAGDQITISDLVYLVDYMFTGGPAPPCFEEADIDGSGVIDINDLVHLVDFMFTFGFPPADCP